MASRKEEKNDFVILSHIALCSSVWKLDLAQPELPILEGPGEELGDRGLGVGSFP